MNSKRSGPSMVLVAALLGGALACGEYKPPTAAPAVTSNTSALLHAGVYSLQLKMDPDAFPPAYQFPACSGPFAYSSFFTDSLAFTFNSLGQWQGAAISPVGGDGAITFSALSGVRAPDGTYQVTVKFGGTFIDMNSVAPCDSIAHDVRWKLPTPIVLLGTVSGDGRSVTGLSQLHTTIGVEASFPRAELNAYSVLWTLTLSAP